MANRAKDLIFLNDQPKSRSKVEIRVPENLREVWKQCKSIIFIIMKDHIIAPDEPYTKAASFEASLRRIWRPQKVCNFIYESEERTVNGMQPEMKSEMQSSTFIVNRSSCDYQLQTITQLSWTCVGKKLKSFQWNGAERRTERNLQGTRWKR